MSFLEACAIFMKAVDRQMEVFDNLNEIAHLSDFEQDSDEQSLDEVHEEEVLL